jgi:hypothetical protein
MPHWRRQSVPAPNREVDAHYSCRSSPQRYGQAELAADVGRKHHLNETEPAPPAARSTCGCTAGVTITDDALHPAVLAGKRFD